MADEQVALEVTDEPDEGTRRLLLTGLLKYNRTYLGEAAFRHLAVVARAAGGGRLLGGLVGETNRGFLYVDLLWVAEGERGRGLGSRLLAAAEAEAVARGCGAAWLDTYDFQARPFYERHGYAAFGTLDGFPGGHRRYFMAKHFAQDAGR
jgi:GNAT superfamily N-acetyltransferase